MVYIQLPVGVFTWEDAKRQCDGSLNILRKYLPSYQHGLQLFMGATDEYDSPLELVSRIIDYLITNGLSPDSITIHHPYSAHQPNVQYNFFFPEAIQKLRETAALAFEKGVRRLTVHFSTSFFHPDHLHVNEQFKWRKEWDDLDEMKREVALKAYKPVKEVALEFPSLKFGMENMPIPVGGNISTNPEEMMVEPLMHSSNSVKEFLEFFKDVPNVGMCLDTAHFLLSKGFVEWMGMNNYSFPGIHFPRSESGGLLDLIDELIRLNKLVDFQLGGAGKCWIPHRQLIEEGVGLSGLDGELLLYAARKVLPLNIGFSLDFDPQRENYSDEEWPLRHSLKKETVKAIELMKREGIF